MLEDSKKYLALGTNLGNRNANLENALNLLRGQFVLVKESSVYETMPLVPREAPADWHKPYLNMVVEVESEISQEEVLTRTQKIERSLGRRQGRKWAPRIIDIDILLWGEEKSKSENLILPHPEILKRSFVLDPLKDLSSEYVVKARSLDHHFPLIMGVINVTPDSFSDGKKFGYIDEAIEKCKKFIDNNVPIIDLGAESTRPGAGNIGFEKEWGRLEPLLEFLETKRRGRRIFPKISLDTFRPKTIESALRYGIDILNDVSGLSNMRLVEIVKENKLDCVFMHSLSVPADPTIAMGGNVIIKIRDWVLKKFNQFEELGLSRDQLIFDPGIGFGKNKEDSRRIIKNFGRFADLPVRTLVGHSRKSFLNPISQKNFKERDLATLGVSMHLVEKKVDILRVHDPIGHQEALKALMYVKN